jgi:hypothetical protein
MYLQNILEINYLFKNHKNILEIRSCKTKSIWIWIMSFKTISKNQHRPKDGYEFGSRYIGRTTII